MIIEEACKEEEDDVLGSSMEVKVLGLVVQYGVSNLWIRCIEGLRWIRGIHVCSFRLQMSVPSAAKDGSLVQMVPSLPVLQSIMSRGTGGFSWTLFAQLKPIMSQEQILEEIGKLQELSQNIEMTLHNAQSVQNSLLPPFTTISSQMPPLTSSLHLTTTSTTTIPPFRPIFPPSQTFVPHDQSLCIDETSSFPQS
ncbi:hypothetical protein Tco_1058635 [Tanacetum coccineum]|uniref:Uncharacterized protein n=1 Tax=Tanacetum coccineum TaxID=301880 RepID=A0ABQ5HAV1_9ASTR